MPILLINFHILDKWIVSLLVLMSIHDVDYKSLEMFHREGFNIMLKNSCMDIYVPEGRKNRATKNIWDFRLLSNHERTSFFFDNRPSMMTMVSMKGMQPAPIL